MSKFNYDQFKIGDFVEVSRTVVRGKDGVGVRALKWVQDIPNGETVLRDGKKTRIAVITGVKYMPLGTTEYDSGDGYYFAKTGSVTVWSVRFSLAGREYNVRPCDAIKCDPPKEFKISSTRYSESDRKNIRDCMEGEPRDAKGRWV